MPALSDDAAVRKYHRWKRILSLGRALAGAAFTLAMVASGYSSALEGLARSTSDNDSVVLLAFLLLFGALESLLTLPLRMASAYWLEHRYRLSNQTFRGWLWEGLKGALVGAAVGIPLVLALYGSLKAFHQGVNFIPATPLISRK